MTKDTKDEKDFLDIHGFEKFIRNFRSETNIYLIVRAYNKIAREKHWSERLKIHYKNFSKSKISNKFKIKYEIENEIIEMYKLGASYREIETVLGISKSSVSRIVNDHSFKLKRA